MLAYSLIQIKVTHMKIQDQEVAQYFFFRQNLITSSCATHYFVVGDGERRCVPLTKRCFNSNAEYEVKLNVIDEEKRRQLRRLQIIAKT